MLNVFDLRAHFAQLHAMQGVAVKHTIETTSEGLRISAAVSPEKQRNLLEEFAKCAAGTCSCPTPQYGKLRSIEVKPQPAGVTVDLKVKAGEAIDVTDIEQCLARTFHQ